VSSSPSANLGLAHLLVLEFLFLCIVMCAYSTLHAYVLCEIEFCFLPTVSNCKFIPQFDKALQCLLFICSASDSFLTLAPYKFMYLLTYLLNANIFGTCNSVWCIFAFSCIYICSWFQRLFLLTLPVIEIWQLFLAYIDTTV